jgi:predicted ribosomally synthesized peptide with SipW-like signal peptide
VSKVPIKKVLGLTIALLLCLGMSSIGTWAYFLDTETVPANQLSAGTLDLKTDDADGVTQTLYASNMAPGDSVSGNLTLENIGSVNGASVDITFDYIENDTTPNPVDMSPDDTSAAIEVLTLDYGGTNLLSSVSDNNSNSYKDIQDLKNANLTGQSGIDASSNKNFQIEVKLRDTINKDLQADGVNVTITFVLNQ